MGLGLWLVELLSDTFLGTLQVWGHFRSSKVCQFHFTSHYCECCQVKKKKKQYFLFLYVLSTVNIREVEVSGGGDFPSSTQEAWGLWPGFQAHLAGDSMCIARPQAVLRSLKDWTNDALGTM